MYMASIEKIDETVWYSAAIAQFTVLLQTNRYYNLYTLLSNFCIGVEWLIILWGSYYIT